MKNKEQIIKSGILEQFALGLTTEEENQSVKEYFIKYPELEERVSSIKDAMSNIAERYGIPSKKKSDNNRKVYQKSKINQFLKTFFTLLVLATILIQYFTILH